MLLYLFSSSFRRPMVFGKSSFPCRVFTLRPRGVARIEDLTASRYFRWKIACKTLRSMLIASDLIVTSQMALNRSFASETLVTFGIDSVPSWAAKTLRASSIAALQSLRWFFSYTVRQNISIIATRQTYEVVDIFWDTGARCRFHGT